MGLSWDATKVEGFDSLTENEAVTRDALVFSTMSVGIREITVENARQFFARVSFWEKVNGPMRVGDGESLYFKPEDVLRFVGLKTNASTLTDAQFRKNVWESHERWNVPRSI